MSLVPKGTVVRIKNSDYGYHSLDYDIAISTGVDWSAGTDWSQFEQNGRTQFLRPGHYEVVSSPAEVVAPVVQQVSEVREEEVPLAGDLPSKAVYVVIAGDGTVLASSSDRDYARGIKSAVGGRRNGAKIFQYAAVKEIR